jgi:hypothetical protein
MQIVARFAMGSAQFLKSFLTRISLAHRGNSFIWNQQLLFLRGRSQSTAYSDCLVTAQFSDRICVTLFIRLFG